MALRANRIIENFRGIPTDGIGAEGAGDIVNNSVAFNRVDPCPYRGPYRGLFPSPPLFDRMPTYRTQGKRSLNFLSARADAAS